MTLTLTVHRHLTQDVASFPEASAAYAQARDLSGLPAGRLPEGEIMEGGVKVARVSYNARVWKLDPAKPLGGGTLVYCPASVDVDEGRPDVFNEGRESIWGRVRPNPHAPGTLEHRVFEAGVARAKSYVS